jgi:hypothetical protein
MGGMSRGQDLEDLVDVETSLNGVEVSRDHVSELTEFILDTLALAVKVLVIPMVTHHGILVHPLFVITSTNFECPNLRELFDKVRDIKLLNHKVMDVRCYNWIFDITNGQKNLGCGVQDSQLGLSFLVDA